MACDIGSEKGKQSAGIVQINIHIKMRRDTFRAVAHFVIPAFTPA